MVNLERSGVLVESSLCCLCGKEEESHRHLFFACNFAWRVWCFCFKWLRVTFVSHINPSSNFAQFRLSLFFDSFNDVWNTIWVRVVGEIRNHKNSIIFNRRVTDASEVCNGASKGLVLDFCKISFCLVFLLLVLGTFGMYENDFFDVC